MYVTSFYIIQYITFVSFSYSFLTWFITGIQFSVLYSRILLFIHSTFNLSLHLLTPASPYTLSPPTHCSFKKKKLFNVIFSLWWFFIAALGLSLVVASGPTLCCGVQTHCGGTSFAEHRFQAHRLSTVAHGFSFSVACEIFPDLGLNQCPLLVGFLTTGPPGKPSLLFFLYLSSAHPPP